MAVVVTGAGGFVGRSVLAHLAGEGVEAVALTSRPGLGPGHGIDLGDSQAVARLLGEVRPSHVLHLGGALEARDLAPFAAANVLHAAVLLDAIRQSGIDSRLLVVGSAAEYGAVSPDHGPVAEDHPAAPTSAYGAVKLAQTCLALASGLPVTVARVSNLVGSGLSSSLALGRFAAHVAQCPRADEPDQAEGVLEVGDLSAVRDIVDVEDVARIVWGLASCEHAAGRIVNVGTGRGVTMSEALDRLLRAFGRRVRVKRGDFASERSAQVSVFVADIGLLQRLLGPQSFVPLDQSFQRMAAAARQEAFA